MGLEHRGARERREPQIYPPNKTLWGGYLLVTHVASQTVYGNTRRSSEKLPRERLIQTERKRAER